MARPRLPWMKFHPRDWLNEPSLRLASRAARGLWIDLICIMWDSPIRGKAIAPNGDVLQPHDIAALVGENRETCVIILQELHKLGVCSHDEKGAIFCRRMLRENRKMEQDRQRASRYYHGDSHGSSNTDSHGGEGRDQKAEVRIQKEDKEKIAPTATTRPVLTPIKPDFQTLTWIEVQNEDREAWKQAAPACDIQAELKRAILWCRDNPQKGTKKNYRRFLTNWLTRQQERGGAMMPIFDKTEKKDTRTSRYT